MLAFELNPAADLPGRSDEKRIASFPDASQDRAIHADFVSKKKNVAAHLAVNGQIAPKHGDGSPDFSGGIDSHGIAEPGNASPDSSGNDPVVARGANIAVHLPANPHGLTTA